MIVRILGEGQYEVGDDQAEALERLDHTLAEAIEKGDEASYAATVAQLHDLVHSAGTEVSAETIVPSKLTIPHRDSSLAELQELLTSEESSGD